MPFTATADAPQPQLFIGESPDNMQQCSIEILQIGYQGMFDSIGPPDVLGQQKDILVAKAAEISFIPLNGTDIFNQLNVADSWIEVPGHIEKSKINLDDIEVKIESRIAAQIKIKVIFIDESL